MKKYFLLILFVLVVQVMLFYKQPESNASDLTPDNILNAVNQERLANNLPALNLDNRLANAAQYKADDMQGRHYFSHTDPEGNYIWNKIVSEGYTPYLQLGENLAIEFYSTESLMSAWMNSPTHRANILTVGFKDQGMGLNFGQQPNTYGSAIVNTFGSLLPAKKSLPITQTQTPVKKSTPKPKTPSKKPIVKEKIPPPPLSAQALDSHANSSEEVQTVDTKTPPPEPLRGEKLIQNFSISPNSLSRTEDINPSSTTTTSNSQLPTPVSSTRATKTVKSTNHLLNNPSLILGSLILLFLLIDLNQAVQSKLAHLDKKINNSLLLILSLLFILFIYWF